MSMQSIAAALRNGAWTSEAKCRGEDTEVFFAPPGEGEVAREVIAAAKKFCNGGDGHPCPVREQCLEYALESNEKFGVWGGMDEVERRRIRRDRRAREREEAARQSAEEARRERRVVVRRRVIIRREVRWK